MLVLWIILEIYALKMKKFISIQNKIDVQSPDKQFFDCCISAKTGEGFDVLIKLINESFEDFGKKEDYKFLIKSRHERLFKLAVDDLKRAKNGLKAGESLELVAEDLKNARSYLDEVVGIKFSDSLLGDIFESFCIGK